MVTSTNLDLDAASHNFERQAARTEIVHSLRLSDEHELELLFVRVVIDILGKNLVNLVFAHGDVVRETAFNVHDVALESFGFLIMLLCLLPMFFFELL